MKKTVTANLGGSVFHIDEDAYQLLDKYLSNLRIHFQKEEGSEEIMNDFEMRFAELFNERTRLGYEVITIEQVEDVIKRMGKPEEIFEEEECNNSESHTQAQHESSGYKKRLMRDPDNKIIGGVCGGIAAYFGWDPTALRIIFFAMIFFGYIIPIYIVLWIIMPIAHTATERLQMRGEKITIENIGKTVTDGFEKVSDHINNYAKSGEGRSGLQKIADIFVQVIGVVLKIFAVAAGIILLPVLCIILLVLFIVFFSLLIGGTSFLYHISPFGIDLLNGDITTGAAVLYSIGTMLMIGIPVISLIYIIGVYLFKWKPMPTGAKWALLVLWLICTALFFIYIQQMGQLIWTNDGPFWMWHNTGSGNYFYLP